jgi:uncharacterized protein YjbI with pentapeptide repeats
MATFTRSDDLQGAEFVDADLRGARFVGADLSGVVMRGVDVQGAEIDAPWLFNGESFLATDAWLGRAILEIEQPFHPLGLAHASAEDDGLDMSIFTTVTPSYADVLEVRSGRVAMVRDFLATVTSDELAATRKNPWGERYRQTTLSCLHVILEEEWEHHRYAVRDLDAIEARHDA